MVALSSLTQHLVPRSRERLRMRVQQTACYLFAGYEQASATSDTHADKDVWRHFRNWNCEKGWHIHGTTRGIDELASNFALQRMGLGFTVFLVSLPYRWALWQWAWLRLKSIPCFPLVGLGMELGTWPPCPSRSSCCALLDASRSLVSHLATGHETFPPPFISWWVRTEGSTRLTTGLAQQSSGRRWTSK